MTHAHALRLLPLLCAALGCVPVAQVPQEEDRLPRRVRRIAVAPFVGSEQWTDRAATILDVEMSRLGIDPTGTRAAAAIGPQLDKNRNAPQGVVVREYEIVGPEGLAARLGNSATAPRTIDEASDLGKSVSADAVLYGRINVTVLRPENIPEDQAPPAAAVQWEATLIDPHTREVFAHLHASLARRPDLAAAAGLPDVLKLDRFARREKPQTLEEAIDEMIGDVTRRFVDTMVRPDDDDVAYIFSNKNVYGKVARYFLFDHRIDQAIDLYRRAVRIRPEDDGSLFALGVLYEKLNDPVEAMNWYEAALRLKPDDWFYRDGRDRVFARVRSGPRPLSDR